MPLRGNCILFPTNSHEFSARRFCVVPLQTERDRGVRTNKSKHYSHNTHEENAQEQNTQNKGANNHAVRDKHHADFIRRAHHETPPRMRGRHARLTYNSAYEHLVN